MKRCVEDKIHYWLHNKVGKIRICWVCGLKQKSKWHDYDSKGGVID